MDSVCTGHSMVSFKLMGIEVIIDCEVGEIICLVASMCLFAWVCETYVVQSQRLFVGSGAKQVNIGTLAF